MKVRYAMTFFATLLASALLCLSVARGEGESRRTRPFSSSEQRRLASGGLVVRPSVKQSGGLRLVGGASWQVINLPQEVVWRALMDTPAYPALLPRVSRARNLELRSYSRVVEITHDGGPFEVRYALRVRTDPARRDASFVLDTRRHHDVRAAWGFFRVRPYGRDRTLLCYGAMLDIGEGVLSGLVRRQVHEWLLKVPSTIKWYVEGRGRSRYLRPRAG